MADTLPPPKFPKNLLAKLRESKIIAVVVIDDPDHAVPLAECLLNAGINAIELTLRTKAAFTCLERIRNQVPDMITGLGTVLCPAQVRQGKDAGAHFAVAPGLCREVIDTAHQVNLPFAPGISNPSDIESALHAGCRLLKFFPAEPCGGLTYLNSMATPYAHLELEFIPLGGLKEQNFIEYLEDPLIPTVGGSWIAPRPLIQSQSWDSIFHNARTARTLTVNLENS